MKTSARGFMVAALLVTANRDILAKTKLLPRHLVSGRKDAAPALIERLGLALLSMSDDDQARKIMLKTDKSTSSILCPAARKSYAADFGNFYRRIEHRSDCLRVVVFDPPPSGIRAFLLLGFELAIVSWKRNFDLIDVVEQSAPLLLVERHRKPAEAIGPIDRLFR